MSELGFNDYKKVVDDALDNHINDPDAIFKLLIERYFEADRPDDWFWDAQDDFQLILAAMYKSVDQDHGGKFADVHNDNHSSLCHFFGGASYEAMLGLGDELQLGVEFISDPLSVFRGYTDDARRDNAFGFLGAWIADQFDTNDRDARALMQMFRDDHMKLTDIWGPITHESKFDNQEFADAWLSERKTWFARKANEYVPGYLTVAVRAVLPSQQPSIGGEVADADGEPAVGIEVRATSGASGGRFVTHADPTGRFGFDGLPSGDYEVSPWIPGYVGPLPPPIRTGAESAVPLQFQLEFGPDAPPGPEPIEVVEKAAAKKLVAKKAVAKKAAAKKAAARTVAIRNAAMKKGAIKKGAVKKPTLEPASDPEAIAELPTVGQYAGLVSDVVSARLIGTWSFGPELRLELTLENGTTTEALVPEAFYEIQRSRAYVDELALAEWLGITGAPELTASKAWFIDPNNGFDDEYDTEAELGTRPGSSVVDADPGFTPATDDFKPIAADSDAEGPLVEGGGGVGATTHRGGQASPLKKLGAGVIALAAAAGVTYGTLQIVGDDDQGTVNAEGVGEPDNTDAQTGDQEEQQDDATPDDQVDSSSRSEPQPLTATALGDVSLDDFIRQAESGTSAPLTDQGPNPDSPVTGGVLELVDGGMGFEFGYTPPPAPWVLQVTMTRSGTIAMEASVTNDGTGANGGVTVFGIDPTDRQMLREPVDITIGPERISLELQGVIRLPADVPIGMGGLFDVDVFVVPSDAADGAPVQRFGLGQVEVPPGYFAVDETLELMTFEDLRAAGLAGAPPGVAECVLRTVTYGEQFRGFLDGTGSSLLVPCLFTNSAIGDTAAAGLAGFAADPQEAVSCIGRGLGQRQVTSEEVASLGTPSQAWPEGLLETYASVLETCVPLRPFYLARFGAFDFIDPACVEIMTNYVLSSYSWEIFIIEGIVDPDPTVRQAAMAIFESFVNEGYAINSCFGAA